jgi:hypothetical protein
VRVSRCAAGPEGGRLVYDGFMATCMLFWARCIMCWQPAWLDGARCAGGKCLLLVFCLPCVQRTQWVCAFHGALRGRRVGGSYMMASWQHACCFGHVALCAGNRLGSTARAVQNVSACLSSCVLHTCGVHSGRCCCSCCCWVGRVGREYCCLVAWCVLLC